MPSIVSPTTLRRKDEPDCRDLGLIHDQPMIHDLVVHEGAASCIAAMVDFPTVTGALHDVATFHLLHAGREDLQHISEPLNCLNSFATDTRLMIFLDNSIL